MCVYARIRFLKMLFSLFVLSTHKRKKMNSTRRIFFLLLSYTEKHRESNEHTCVKLTRALSSKPIWKMRVRGAVTKHHTIVYFDCIKPEPTSCQSVNRIATQRIIDLLLSSDQSKNAFYFKLFTFFTLFALLKKQTNTASMLCLNFINWIQLITLQQMYHT